MKRNAAGSYTQIIDGQIWYAVRMENGWWTVGINLPSGSAWIDDFKTLRAARAYIMRQAEQIMMRKAEKVGASKESTKLAWCEKCDMETCWFLVSKSKPKDFYHAEWDCDRCHRQAEKVGA